MSAMLARSVVLSVLMLLSSPGLADTLEARLVAAETRIASLGRSPGGNGAEILLVGSRPIMRRASEGAAEADMAWANHVMQAYALALAVGVSPLEQVLITQSLGQTRSVSVEGGLPISESAATVVLAKFFKALIRDSGDVPLDIYAGVLGAPDDWAAVLSAIREASVSTPSLIAGTTAVLSSELTIRAGALLASAHSPTPGISIDSVSLSGGQVSMAITAHAAVPKGLHPVYFYTDDSKFEPVASLNLRIDPPIK